MTVLDQTTAAEFTRLTLGHLTREWPYKPDLILASESDLRLPRELHPIFHGSFDWHSCVHGWWQVVTLTRLFPDMVEAGHVWSLADCTFTHGKVAGEVAFFKRPTASTFERPYGWAWLLSLHGELARFPSRPWADALEPLAQVIAAHFDDYLPKLLYPVRSGKHDCTAFALIHALAWSRNHDANLAMLIEERAREWFMTDADARPWEPSGEDFLSATLCEAVLMRETLDAPTFERWIAQFLPDPLGRTTACLCMPAMVSDRSDGRLAHLDGLNLSRAWCWRRLADALPDRATAHQIADDHLAAALPHLADDYMGEHWLATFALLALIA